MYIPSPPPNPSGGVSTPTGTPIIPLNTTPLPNQSQIKRLAFSCYAVEWSPFYPDRLAVATAQYFGLVGNGSQVVLRRTPQGLIEEFMYKTNQGCFDVAWSEANENQLVSSVGDGTIKLWDTKSAANPLRVWQEHAKESYSVNWDPIIKDRFVSSSWDKTIKVWTILSPRSVVTLLSHTGAVYNADFSPHMANVIASCSEDKSTRVWDTRKPPNKAILRLAGHNHEVLALDWNKYDQNVLATGSADTTIKVWDLRRPSIPMHFLNGHKYAVRKLRFSPHRMGVLVSGSYDMSVNVWNYTSNNPLLRNFSHHTEFICGVGLSLFEEGLVADCSWDKNCLDL